MACEGDFGVTLESLFVYDGDVVATLGSLGGHFWDLKSAFGGILRSLREHLRHMGVTLGSLWGYFGISLGSVWVSVGDFGSLDGRFAMIVESL